MWRKDLETIQQNFVCVAIDGRSQGGDDADATFLREAGLKFSGAGGNRVAITADGKVLGTNFQTCVHDALKAWNELPEAQRKPDAVEIPEPDTPNVTRVEPPPGGLVVKAYLRALGRNEDGSLRHAEVKDWLGECTEDGGAFGDYGELLARYQEVRPSYKATPHQLELIANQFRTRSRMYEAHPDFLWLTEAEWKSLVPDDPNVGDEFPMPENIARRILRFHLDLNRTIGDPIAQKIHVGQLSIKVFKVSPDQIQLRVSGLAKVSDGHRNGGNLRTFEARLYGWLDYDRKQEAFTRFDMLALGETYGPFEAGLGHFPYSRPGRSPYGIAIEMLSENASPAERRVPPRGGGPRFTYESYFGAK